MHRREKRHRSDQHCLSIAGDVVGMLNDVSEKSFPYVTLCLSTEWTHFAASPSWQGPRRASHRPAKSKIVCGSITEVFLWPKQAASNIFSEKCLGQK